VKTYETCGVTYTIRKDGEWFYATCPDGHGGEIEVRSTRKRIALRCICAHIANQSVAADQRKRKQ
jgi:hypothetical protein